jgi:hypothetical protein
VNSGAIEAILATTDPELGELRCPNPNGALPFAINVLPVLNKFRHGVA